MKIERLTLTNFRGFESLDLAFEPDVTVLVGVNGAGKTSILDALAIALSHLTAGIATSEDFRASPIAMSVNDVRTSESAACVGVWASFDDTPTLWRVALTLPGFDSGDKTDVSRLNPPIAKAQMSNGRGEGNLPLAVCFPTNRGALDIPTRLGVTKEAFNAISAYDGALSEGASNFRGFFEWFREEEDVFNQRLAESNYKDASFTRDDVIHKSALSVVRRAIEALFPGGDSLRVDRRPQRMTIDRNGVRLDVSQLSDGEKCLIAMVGDLARRMVLVSQGHLEPLEQQAVVMIDELELHLHPGLQREIIPRLRKVFPNTQFIVTTHSPQVLSSVHARNVRVLENFALKPLNAATWHRDTNRILESAFGDPGRPPEVAEKINQLRQAVDDDRVDDARKLIEELRTVIEGEDPDVFFLEQLLPPEVPEGES